ncbi:MAG: hypothetical protein GX213_04095 [Clostridiaceae bacterium]|nr:hypothetical protein [Clostridiaceae bacterium]
MNNISLCDKRYPVERPEDFIGREEILWKIKDKVFSGNRNCIAIIADDGIGKSSLVNYIYFEETQKNLIDDCEKNLVVLINNAEPTSFEDFFFILHEALHENIQLSSFMSDEVKAESEKIFSGEKGVLNAKTIFELKNLLNRLLYFLYKKSITTTIIIDDIDKMTKAIGDRETTDKKRKIAKESFSYLRAKASDVRKCDIRYIITSKKPLKSISNECYESGFPGIFENETLELFSDKEVDHYLIKCNMDPEKEKYNVVRRVSGGFPGILRSACKVMNELEEKGEGFVSEDEFLKRVASDAAIILESQWNISDEKEKKLYKAIAMGNNVELNKDWSIELETGVSRRLLNSDGQFRSTAFYYYVKNIAVLNDEKKDDTLEEQNKILAESHKMKDEAISVHRKTIEVLLEQNKQLFSKFIAEDSRIKQFNDDILNREDKKDYNEYVKDVFQKYMAINISETSETGTVVSTLEKRISSNVWEAIGKEHRRLIVEAELLFDVYRKTDNDQSPVGVLYGKVVESLINKIAFPKIKSLPIIQNSDIILSKDGETRLLTEWDSIYIGNFRYVMNQCRYRFEQDNVLRHKFREIYTFGFRNKLEEIRTLRNKCDHEKKEPSDKVTPEDIEIMRDALFGARKDDTGIMEAIVKLLDM